MASRTRGMLPQVIHEINLIAQKQYSITTLEAQTLITYTIALFKTVLLADNRYTEESIRPITTKFRDAGRRSAPWRPTSQRVPGRPQDGADGNRINRWLLPVEHKFYADEINATLVEVKYIFQTLSMSEAPPLPQNSLQDSFLWLLKHKIEPGVYQDPIQLIPLYLPEFIANPRLIQSGHLVPLDRKGKHIPDNAFLMLARSNQIQGNQTLDELIELMRRIVLKHNQKDLPPELNVSFLDKS